MMEDIFFLENSPPPSGEKKIKAVELPIKNGMVVLMDHPSTFTVHTYVAIRVLSGGVSVLGYEITPNEEEPVEVFSSEKTGLIEIKTKTDDHISKKSGTIEEDLKELFLDVTQDSHKTSLLLSNLGTCTAAIFVQKVVYPINLQFVQLYYPYLFDFNSGKKEKADIYVKNGTPIRFGQKVENLTSEIMKCIRDAKLANTDAPRVLVYGPKGSGKSTLIRYFVNKILSVYKAAFYLDTDPGQTEFTPPGVVSLTKVMKPIFGPSFCHQRKPISMVFTGSIHPTSIDDYSKGVCGLMNLFKRKYRDEPLFVNTMGWMEGLGLKCLQNIISIIQPTIVVEIETEEISSMFDYRGYVDSRCQYYQICQSFYKTIKAYSPKENREFALLSYFGKPKCQNPFIGPVPVPEIRPYYISWDDIAVYICNHVIQPQRLVEAINLSIVALCVVPESRIVESSLPNYQRTLDDASENTCLGYGLVRAIDEAQHILYFVTPLEDEELDRVNVIMKGNVMIPDVVILKQKIYHEPLPFTNVRDVPNINDEENQDISMVSVTNISAMDSSP